MTEMDLFKLLRCCQAAKGCASCEALPGCSGIDGLIGQAADRLEALLAENEHLREVTKMMPKWVSGKTATVREFADKYGLAYSCLYARIKSGWDVETALLTPSKRGGTP